ncbi:MAG: SpoIID/LytB domain-containing protein [Nitrospirota bacterium]
MKRLLLTFIILSLTNASEAVDIRVGILNSEESVKIIATGYMDIIDLSTNEIVLTTYGWPGGFIKATQVGLEMKDVGVINGSVLLKPIVGAKTLVNGNRYRGELEIQKNGNGVKVINVIDLEEYLYGILKNEMSAKAPIESLKAQAIIARTFALANLKKHEQEGYNLCPKIHCQVYKGMDTETDNIISAVDSTRGQILTYDGEIAQTFYHSCCGGVTADALSVWGKDIPYLKEVYDPFCKKSNDIWTYTISLNEIQNRFNIGNISSIYPDSKNSGGRVNNIVIEHTNGVATIPCNKFRLMLGSDKIWSTMLTISRNGAQVTFQGKGKGHGVGLCQRGAVAMGELGYNYKQILGFYYPGVYLRSIVFEEE